MRSELLRNASAVLIIAIASAFAGCLNVKPVADTSRYFVLTPLLARSPEQMRGPAVGIGRVEIPDYLQSKRIALRKGNSEIEYSETLQWAERLDKGIQRALAANLGSLLNSTNIVLSAWRRSEVQAEVYVSVQRFESDEHGNVAFEAQWRVASSGGDTTLRTGTSKIIRQGPSMAKSPDGAVAALSAAVADLSREIAAPLLIHDDRAHLDASLSDGKGMSLPMFRNHLTNAEAGAGGACGRSNQRQN